MIAFSKTKVHKQSNSIHKINENRLKYIVKNRIYRIANVSTHNFFSANFLSEVIKGRKQSLICLLVKLIFYTV